MDRYTDYDPFADVYDRHWGAGADRFLAVFDRLVGALPKNTLVLDLCCGTGRLAAALTARGLRVVGVDGSAAMVDLARRNAPRAGFLVADARSFALAEPAAVAVSTWDSLNHIMTLPDLERAFRCVRASLDPGGTFLFDLNMEEGYRARWQGSFGIVGDDEVIVARSRFDAEAAIGTIDFTVMALEGDCWHRSDLSLTQRCYREDEVRATLARAGFEQVEVFTAGDVDLAEVGRAFFRSHAPATGR